MIVGDCFFQAGATGSGEEAVERMHSYIEGSRVIFHVQPRSWFITLDELRVSTSDEGVFQVIRAEVVPLGFLTFKYALEVEISTFNSGEADLVFANAGGEVDRRTLRVVVPDAVRLEIPISVPSIEDPDIDMSALRVGDMGAELVVSYESDGERADGFAAVSLPLDVDPSVFLETVRLSAFGDPAPQWDVLHLVALSEPYAVDLMVNGVALGTVQVIPANGTDVDSAEFAERQNIVDYLADHIDIDIPNEVLDAVKNSNDAKILCGKNNKCVAKVEPRDADGRAIFGALIAWDLGTDAPAANVNGDLVLFTKGFGHAHDVTATINGISQTLTIDAEPESVTIISSTDAHCAQMGTDTAATAFAGVLLLRFRRRIVGDPTRVHAPV